MSEFDDLIRLRRTDEGAAGTPADPATYAGALSAGWSVGKAVNGGAVLSVVGNAVSDLLGTPTDDSPGHPDPLSVSAVYLSPGVDGPCEVRVETLRRGGRTSVARATLSQEGADRVHVLATYTDLSVWEGETYLYGDQPAIPAPEDCVSRDGGPALTERLDLRLDPDCVGWALGEPSGRGMLQIQVAFADGRPWDPVSLLLAPDVILPTTTDLGLAGWAPTVELTVHVRATPAPGFLHVRHATRFMSGGLFEEDAEVWDSAGTLVAQARQLAMVPKSAR